MLNPIKYSPDIEPAIEAVLYGNIKCNTLLKNQNELRLPKGNGNEIMMISPSAEATYQLINSRFPAFKKSAINAYVTDARISRKIGKKNVLINGVSNFRNQYLDSVSDRTIKFYTTAQYSHMIESCKSFIYDTGKLHELYFTYRYTNKGPVFLCTDYMSFLYDLIDNFADSYKKILYISINQWALTGAKFGVTNDMLNNPISILLKCMLKYPEYIANLAIRECDILLVNEPKGEVIKIEIGHNLIQEDGKINNTSLNKIYTRLRNKLASMSIPNINTTMKTADELKEGDAVSTTETPKKKIQNLGQKKPCPIAEEVKRQLTGAPVNSSDDSNEMNVIFDDDGSVLGENDIEEEPEQVDSINEEIKDVIDDAVNNIPELTDDTVSDADKKKILEEEVKRKVYLSKFVPERTKKQLKYIEVGEAAQAKAMSQSIEQLKSKVIEENEVGNTVSTNNVAIKHIKYANADKTYVEKKYIPDINNAVAKLADADIKVFIESIEEVDSSDQMNQKKTLTYHLVDELGKKHTLVFDVPIIYDGCHMYLAGSRKMMLHQRIYKPIVKIAPNMVQIISYYNKVSVARFGNMTNEMTGAIKKFFTKHSDKYQVRFGNAKANNLKYKTSMEFDDLSKSFSMITFPTDANSIEYTIDFDLTRAEERYLKEKGADKEAFQKGNFYCIIIKDSHGKRLDCLPHGADISEFIHNTASKPIQRELDKFSGGGKKFAFCKAKILHQFIPVALFCLYCEGFHAVMDKCKIKWNFYSSLKEYNAAKFPDPHRDYIKLADGILEYFNDTTSVGLFMNGLKGIGLDGYTMEELESRDTYIDLLTVIYGSANQTKNLDKFRQFLIDNKTKEILEDFDMPTDLTEIMYYTCQLLSDNQYLADIDLRQIRIRSDEIVSQLVYQHIIEAYSKYKEDAYKSKPTKISIPKDCIIKDLLCSSLCDEDSVVNPIYQLEKTRAVTLTGSVSTPGITLTGVNKVDGYTMDKRAYDESMIGVFGLTSPADANVGLIRDLSLEPNITSTNGYIDVTPMSEVNNLSTANLFTAVELLTPPGVLHDDPQRSSMMRGQSSKMVMVDGSSPVLIGNKVESVVAYHLNNDYCFTAKEDGKIVDEQDGIYIIQYKSGKYESFDTNETVNKNASDGSYTRIKMETKYKIGDKFNKNDILAVEPHAFTFNKFDRGASCNIGVLAKVAVTSLWDVFEDSEPMTKSLSEKLGFESIKNKGVNLSAPTYVEKIVKIGDHVNIGDPLMVFDNSRTDPEVQKYLNKLRTGLKDKGIVEDLIESGNSIIKAPTTGIVTDIKIFITCPVEELSPSLQEIVKTYHKAINKKEKFLDKYKNPGDNDFYKCGRLITETTGITDTKYGKLKGEEIGDGVRFEFYISHHDIVKKGDKSTNYIAAKGVNSHIIAEGYEPWSENNPDEEISAFITPVSTPARKIPSIYPVMFGNKVLIEAKRKMCAKYIEGRGLKSRKKK